MKKQFIMLSALSLALFASSMVEPAFAKSKHWTIAQRQVALQSRVGKGERSFELTKAEADKFRDRLADASSRIEKMKSKNGGKLSYKDQGKIENELNAISIDIEKKELKKRVESR